MSVEYYNWYILKYALLKQLVDLLGIEGLQNVFYFSAICITLVKKKC